MIFRRTVFACCILLGAAACSSGTPTEPSGYPIPDGPDRNEYPAPPKP